MTGALRLHVLTMVTMSHHMLVQIALVSSAVRTEVTDVRFDSSVLSSDVRGKVRLSHGVTTEATGHFVCAGRWGEL